MTRARLVLCWIAEVEARPWLSEHVEDVLLDHRLAPGKALLIGIPPLLPLDLNVMFDA
jgi:hypothetical protein